MTDYREWCRLCGALNGSVDITSNNFIFVEQLFKVKKKNVSKRL